MKPCVTRKTTQYCHCLCLSSVCFWYLIIFFMLLTLSPNSSLSLDFCRGLSFLFFLFSTLPLSSWIFSFPLAHIILCFFYFISYLLPVYKSSVFLLPYFVSFYFECTYILFSHSLVCVFSQLLLVLEFLLWFLAARSIYLFIFNLFAFRILLCFGLPCWITQNFVVTYK